MAEVVITQTSVTEEQVTTKFVDLFSGLPLLGIGKYDYWASVT